MICFRNADRDVPFFWESEAQPPARWHAAGDGPAHYMATTPDAAWAEFLRHAEITDPADLAGVERAMWAIEVPDDEPLASPRLARTTLVGGRESYPRCQREASRLRVGGASGLRAPSAALRTGPSGWRTQDGLRPGPLRRAETIVLFGLRPELIGWAACAVGRPRADLVGRVRHL
ncbi:MAG TPA: RES domain-containing protein [Candidatus Limnocylindria bacterium]|nr:RES domain-containing protein [Candidatus Limnocylindria bacterium]